MPLNVGDKVTVKEGSVNADAEGSIIKIQYWVQFADYSAGCYNVDNLIPNSVEPVVESEAVSPKTETSVKKK